MRAPSEGGTGAPLGDVTPETDAAPALDGAAPDSRTFASRKREPCSLLAGAGDLKPATALVALGSNLSDPAAQVNAGFAALGMLPDTRVTARSSLYRSAPVGYAGQPDFINAVAVLETTLAPRALLEGLLAIERRHGRVREFLNAPRTLDLDVLLYGDLQLHEHGLTIPHPRMHERAFVLLPLAEIAPRCVIPGHGAVAELLRVIDAGGVIRLAAAA